MESREAGRFRSLFIGLVLAAILVAFGMGWLVPGTYAVELNDSEFFPLYRQARRLAVEQPAETPGWVGSYAKSDPDLDVHGMSLDIASDQQYFMEYHGCMSSGPWSFGRVTVDRNGGLSFRPSAVTGGADRAGWKGTLVRWGPRLYIVQNDELPRFWKAVESGREPRNRPEGDFYLRQGDWNKPVFESPTRQD